jgi:hypothetical protein
MDGFVKEEFTTRALDLAVQDYGAHFLAVVDQAADSVWIVEEGLPPRAAAAYWRVGISPQVSRATFQPDPMLSLGELWALAHRQRVFFETGPGSEDFGSSQGTVVEAARELEALIERTAFAALDDPEFLQDRVLEWAANYPYTSYRFDTPSMAQAVSGWLDEPLSAGVGAVADVATAIAHLDQRVSFILEDAPREMKWHAAQITTNLASSQVMESARARVDSLTQIAVGLEEAISRAVLVLEGAGEGINETLEREREAVLADLHRQREETLVALANERIALMAFVTAEREAVTRDLAQARQGIRDDMALLADSVLSAAEIRGRTIVDHIFWRLLQLLAIGYVAVVLAVVALRRRREPSA